MTERTDIQMVTSETLEAFNAERLNIKQPEPDEQSEGEVESEPVEQADPEPEVKAEKEEEPEKPRRKKGLEDRFQELTGERDEQISRADKAEQRAKELEAEVQRLKNPPQAEPQEPQRGDFQSDDDFIEAKSEYKAYQKIQQKAWDQTFQKAAIDIPDFNEVIGNAKAGVTDEVVKAIKESQLGPYLIYELANNPELTDKINRLSSSHMLKELGKLEAKVEAKLAKAAEPQKAVEQLEQPKVKLAEVSKAPAPIRPLSSNTVDDRLIDGKGEFKGTPEQYRALRQAGKI